MFGKIGWIYNTRLSMTDSLADPNWMSSGTLFYPCGNNSVVVNYLNRHSVSQRAILCKIIGKNRETSLLTSLLINFVILVRFEGYTPFLVLVASNSSCTTCFWPPKLLKVVRGVITQVSFSLIFGLFCSCTLNIVKAYFLVHDAICLCFWMKHTH